MAGSGSNGKWEASTVTDQDIRDLKQAGYLPANVFHRAPEKNQVIPTPRQARGWCSSPTLFGD